MTLAGTVRRMAAMGTGRMSAADRQAWQSARTLADLGALAACWLERSITSQPGYAAGYGPAEETLPLVPVLAALNRAGYFTNGSQPGMAGRGFDGAHWEQRAAVEGFASAGLTSALGAAAERAGLIVIALDPAARPKVRINGRPAVDVTRRGGRARTAFGAHLSRAHLYDAHTGYGICRPDAIAAVCGAWQVTVIDPEWGRPDVLWAVLAGVISSPRPGAAGTPEP